MLCENDTLRAVSVHSLEVPDGVVVFNLGSEHMTPAPRDSFCDQIVIYLPVFSDRFHIGSVAGISIPRWIHRQMGAIGRCVVIRMIEINDVVQFVGRHEKGSVIGGIGADTTIRIFAGFGQPGDVVADPASAAVASVDAACWMVAFEMLQQSAEVLISG